MEVRAGAHIRNLKARLWKDWSLNLSFLVIPPSITGIRKPFSTVDWAILH